MTALQFYWTISGISSLSPGVEAERLSVNDTIFLFWIRTLELDARSGA